MDDDAIRQLREDVAALRRDLHALGIGGAAVEARIAAIERDLARMVPVARYQPVERAVYGTIGLMLAALLGAVMTLVLR